MSFLQNIFNKKTITRKSCLFECNTKSEIFKVGKILLIINMAEEVLNNFSFKKANALHIFNQYERLNTPNARTNISN